MLDALEKKRRPGSCEAEMMVLEQFPGSRGAAKNFNEVSA